jgi:cytochrome c biogenesis protein CcdA
MLSKLKKLSTFLFKLSDMTWHHYVFIYGLYLSYLLLFIAFTGIVSFSPQYLHILRFIINYYIIFILLIRFNPLISKTNVKVDSAFDRRVVFSAACFMLISSSLFGYVDSYIHARY